MATPGAVRLSYGDDAAAHPTYGDCADVDPSYGSRGVVAHEAPTIVGVVLSGSAVMEGQ